MDKKKRAEMEALAADHESWDNHVATQNIPALYLTKKTRKLIPGSACK